MKSLTHTALRKLRPALRTSYNAGFIATEIHASGGEPNRIERVKAFVPMLRGGTAEEVAQAILWLLSEESAYTTGSFVEVTGGR